ncbi:MAG: DUF1385 domain-containing protein [Chloroflexota bacterium]
MKSRFHYGGQALIEGVMMRGQRHVAVAVRRPDGQVAVTTQPLNRLYTGPWRERPLTRGIIMLAETLTIGLRALMYSAQAAIGEEEDMPRGAMTGAVVVAVLFAVGLFFALPYLLARLLGLQGGGNFTAHLAEGGLRLAVFVAYLLLVGRWSEVARVFAYHGAEHKVVNAHEAGVALEVEAVRGFSTAHKRCGTSFVLLVLVIAIPVFALIGRPPIWAALPLRLVLLPIIAAASYEIIRLGGSHPQHPLVRAILAPGMVIQAMTTRPPDDRQLEVALAAMKGVLAAEAEVLPAAASPALPPLPSAGPPG